MAFRPSRRSGTEICDISLSVFRETSFFCWVSGRTGESVVFRLGKAFVAVSATPISAELAVAGKGHRRA